MAAIVIPAEPEFAHESERMVWDVLRRKLRDCDGLLSGVRFSDPEYGDVEIDILVLMPDCGAVAIEVKDGAVSYRDGGWKQTDALEYRSIDPARQDRNGAHSLRRFLQRQHHWSPGQVRASWMIAPPHTHVAGDLGPVGRRNLLIGEQGPSRDSRPRVRPSSADRHTDSPAL